MHLPYTASSLTSLPWTNPGNRPYTGLFSAALLHYAGEIPREPLDTLLQLIKKPADHGRYVVIDRSGIHSPDRTHTYGDLRMMHFADGQVLKAVLTTDTWSDELRTGALIFEAGQYAICIPTVCRNVSIVTRLTPPVTTPYVPSQVYNVPEPKSALIVTTIAAMAWLSSRIRRRRH